MRNDRNTALMLTLVTLVLAWLAVGAITVVGSEPRAHLTHSEDSPPTFKNLVDLISDDTVQRLPALGAARPGLAPAAASHPSRILVRFRPGVPRAAMAAAHNPAQGQRVIRDYSVVPGLQLVQVRRGDVNAALAQYRANPNVLYCEPDYEVHAISTPNDPSFGLLWGMENTGQIVEGSAGTPGADIRITKAWDVWTGDPNFRIAVIDTGIDYTHPDLAANVWVNPGEIPDNGVDDDGNGFVDDVHGYDFVNFDGDPMDDHGHGSHVSGTIGAVGNNGIGVVGVNWSCKLVGLKFLSSSGSGFTSGAIAAIEYMVGQGILISNNSWGSSFFSQALYDAIDATNAIGHLFVAAAGNTGLNADQFPHYPAAFDLPNIISVAAMTSNDQIAFFSTFGLTTVDIGAPGVNIYSTVLGEQFDFFQGTSMAAPHVAGVAALFRSRLTSIDALATKAHLLSTVRPLSALDGRVFSGGMVDAFAVIDDCNRNGVSDAQEIADGLLMDCTGNGIPDSCEPDCNGNNIADSCDLASGVLTDCSGNGLPDQCEPDCDNDGIADSCELFTGSAVDCDNNRIPDNCEPDCDGNGVTDACDIRDGTHPDCTGNGIPDLCEPDCDMDGTPDTCAIAAGLADDCNENDIPDNCDIAQGMPDCNANGVPDSCDPDCDGNGVPDECDLSSGAPDCTGNGILDVCEFDCNSNGEADSCEIAAGTLPDSNGDGVADVCVFGFQLVPVSATGVHTINGREITLDAGGQKVVLEVRMLGWNPLINETSKLRAYQAAIEPTSFDNGIGALLDFSRIPCTIDASCPDGFFSPGVCVNGFCDAQSSHIIDELHSQYVFRGLNAIAGTFRNPGFPPFAGALLSDPVDSVRFSGATKYGVTITLDIPEGASGRYVIDFLQDQTFWLKQSGAGIPVPQYSPAIILLPQDCNGNGIEDSDEIANGTVMDCNLNGIPDVCLSLELDCNSNSLVDECEIADGVTPDINGNGIPDDCEGTILFVNKSATGSGTGLTWANAFTNLQDALDLAKMSAGGVAEIWVAAGTYRPTALPTTIMDNRTKTFVLVGGVALYGGFAGGETRFTERDVNANVTILSGDLGNNDGPNFTGNGENSYHVVAAWNVDQDTILDGFTITAGNGNGSGGTIAIPLSVANRGGGIYMLSASPTISHCIFTRNKANAGAGMGSEIPNGALPIGSMRVTDCLFLDNFGNQGGAMWSTTSSIVIVKDCRFIGNTGIIGGGAVTNFGNEMTFLNCLFTGNAATTSFSQGGAIEDSSGATTTLINCTVVNNTSNMPPGGLAMGGSNSTLINNIIWGNRGNASTTQLDQLFTASPEIRTVVINNNDIEGWIGDLGGVGNIGADPMFIDLDGPDDIIGTLDDNLHVTTASPTFNAGDSSAIPVDLSSDLDGFPRIVDLAIDMGAYEVQLPPNCDAINNCSGNGECVKDDTCVCNAGWFGVDCSSFQCFGDCFGNGTCVAPDTCVCFEGYDAASFCSIAIPAVSNWGVLILSLLMLTAATVIIRDRRVPA